ncbi:MAG: glycoside hydrolase family 88 protein [Cyclobacteriaceae bacterium]
MICIIRITFFSLLIGLLALACTPKSDEKSLVERSFETASEQTRQMLQVATDPTRIPRTTAPDGSFKTTNMYDWTSGFFAGNLWYLYEYTKDEDFKQEAIRWTEALEPLKTFTGHHDLGFMMYCSYGNGYRLTNNEAYKDILVESAKSLCTRYNPITKSIKSWDYRKNWDGVTEWFFPVIIDNMMNLELLFFATEVTGNNYYKDFAISHAETTIKNHIRDDFSTYHVVDYDTLTGEVKDQATCQGFTDQSTWARGQAWGIYGFVMMYRETKDNKYLETAQKLADYYLNHPNMPEDLIPYWDFYAIDENHKPLWDYDPEQFKTVPRDASAAAIVSSALIEMSNYLPVNGQFYFEKAEKMLKSLSSPDYMAEPGSNNNFVLMHSVGSIPHGAEINVPLVYADYYFFEALLRYENAK